MNILEPDKKKTILLLRWLVFIVVSYLMVFSKSYIPFFSLSTALISLFFVSNLILTILPVHIFSYKGFDYVFVLIDTIFVTIGLYVTGNSSSEFYLVYFLIIITTTFGSDLKAILRNTIMVSAVYTVMLFQDREIEPVIYSEGIMLRPPFFFVMSLFYGYLVEQARTHMSKTKDLEDAKKELEVILEITRSVSSTLDIQEVLKTIVNKVASYVNVDRCSIILVDECHQHGYVVASHDVPEVDNLKIELYKYPEIYRALKEKEVIIINDVSSDPILIDIREVLNQKNIKSLLVVPIAYKEEIIGTLFLRLVRERHEFTQEEIRFCQVVANTSANAIKNAQLFEQIKIQAETDGLTQLLNHRSFLEKYKEEVIKAERLKKPFTVMMIDVDNFKSINDAYGHQYGDKVLFELARCLTENTRGGDTVARYGGDEFICLLPDASHEQGLMIATRIIDRIRNIAGKGLTVSIGLVTYFYHTDQASKLIQLADQAMYIAKYRGGNQIFYFDPSDTRDMRTWNKKVFEIFLVIKNLSRFDENEEIGSPLIKQFRKILSVDNSPQSVYDIVTSLSSALDARDHYTNGHSERVIRYAKRIATELFMPAERQEELVYLCLLHDIGKIGIPDHILNKPGRLSREEFEIMKRHAEIGEKIISPIEVLEDLKPLIRHHQEWYDGSGYPDGLKGDMIPLACRILSVVDTFDAMTTDRPYRKALSIDKAVDELIRCTGTQFDPQIVDIFLRILNEEGFIKYVSM